MKHVHIRKFKNTIFQLSIIFCAAIALVPLFSIFIYILKRGTQALSWTFFTSLPSPIGSSVAGGMGNALLGSLYMVSIAGSIGIPLGISIGIFLSESPHSRLAQWTRSALEILVSTPSIVIGLFVYAVVVAPMKRFSGFAGAMALAIILIPLLARTTEEMLKQVPASVREAGLALGLPHWKVTLFILLRAARAGIATGVLLSLARISGETAPLLFTALNNQYWPRTLDQPVASLPVQIYTFAISPFEEWQSLAFTGALVLLGSVFVINLVTRLILLKKT